MAPAELLLNYSNRWIGLLYWIRATDDSLQLDYCCTEKLNEERHQIYMVSFLHWATIVGCSGCFTTTVL